MEPSTVVDWYGQGSTPADDERLAALYDLDARFDDPGIDWFRGLARMTGGPILELGVGSGRVAIPVAKDGHEVVGIDRSPAMLKRAEHFARRSRVNVRLVEADMRSFSLDRAFALITIPFNTFLMLSEDDRWACLARCREHLTPTGRLAIDIFQPDPNVISGLDGGVREYWRRVDPDTKRTVAKFGSERGNVDGVTIHWWFDEELEDGSIRRIARETHLTYLYRHEGELLFSAAGFEIDSLHGDYQGSPVTSASRQLLFVLRRRERGSRLERRRR